MSRREPAPPAAGQARGWRPWLPALLWAALIFLVSSRPTVSLPQIEHIDKLAHFGTYLVLGVLLARAARRSGRLSVGWVVLVGVLYGATDELHQSFVPGRHADLADWLADSLGVVAGVGGYHAWRSTRRRGRRRPAPRSNSALAHD